MRGARRPIVWLLVAGAVVIVLGMAGAVGLCTRGNPLFGEIEADGTPVVLRGRLNIQVDGRGVAADLDPLGRTTTLLIDGTRRTETTLAPGGSVTIDGWGTLTVVRIIPAPVRRYARSGGSSGVVEARFLAG